MAYPWDSRQAMEFGQMHNTLLDAYKTFTSPAQVPPILPSGGLPCSVIC